MLAVVLVLALHLAYGESASCLPYQSACTFFNGATCCGFPLTTLCLPDNNSGLSCLSPFDVQNLSPALTSLNPFASTLGQVQGTLRRALNPASDPLANPILDPLANPILDPLANPILDPLANPTFDPLLPNNSG